MSASIIPSVQFLRLWSLILFSHFIGTSFTKHFRPSSLRQIKILREFRSIFIVILGEHGWIHVDARAHGRGESDGFEVAPFRGSWFVLLDGFY